MKSLFFFTMFFLSLNIFAQSTGKSPERNCVDAHMRLWDLTPWQEKGNKKKRFQDKSKNYQKYKFLYKKEYYESYNSKQINSLKKLRAEFEADAWVRCMKK